MPVEHHAVLLLQGTDGVAQIYVEMAVKVRDLIASAASSILGISGIGQQRQH